MPAHKRKPRTLAENISVPFAMLVRMFVLGTVAVVASTYALYRHYAVPRAPMVVPVPPPTEIPVPNVETIPP